MVPAVALKVPVAAPAAIVTEEGSVRAALSSERTTRLPPAGAAVLSVTVQVLLPPDGRLIQLQADVKNSEAQLGDKRLTAAQDLVWAFINTPAFLFNR